MKRLSWILALAGLLATLALAAWFGIGNVAAAVGEIGLAEFGVILLWQGVTFLILGLAWAAIMPSRHRRRAWVPIWGRMVRDAAGTCLPFSQVGAIVFGTRALTLHGVKWPTATASIVVDVTAEFLAQLVFAGVGIGILVSRMPASDLAVPLQVGLGLATIACFGFVWLQQGAASIFSKLGRRIAGQWFDNAQERVEVVQAELGLIYGHSGRLLLGFALHLLGWFCTGVAGWLCFRALGAPIGLDDALAIEALLSVAAVATFLVPLHAGVQEAGYAGLGAIFGIPPEISIGVSLVRRARDVAAGVPILLVWQLVEVRRLRSGPAARSEG